MKKYWIQHHRRASDDPRMKLLKETLGYAGIGVYWEIVERIETWGRRTVSTEDAHRCHS